MKISCECGNVFDFECSEERGSIEGFSFETGNCKEHGDYMLIHCNKCDKAIVMTGAEEIEEEEDGENV